MDEHKVRLEISELSKSYETKEGRFQAVEKIDLKVYDNEFLVLLGPGNCGKTVLLNMEGLHTEGAQRIIDFASGAVYSINGNLQKISNYIFTVTPDNVDLSGDFQDILGNVGMGANNGPLDISGLNLRL